MGTIMLVHIKTTEQQRSCFAPFGFLHQSKGNRGVMRHGRGFASLNCWANGGVVHGRRFESLILGSMIVGSNL
jgi:hypothetical protein